MEEYAPGSACCGPKEPPPSASSNSMLLLPVPRIAEYIPASWSTTPCSSEGSLGSLAVPNHTFGLFTFADATCAYQFSSLVRSDPSKVLLVVPSVPPDVWSSTSTTTFGFML